MDDAVALLPIDLGDDNHRVGVYGEVFPNLAAEQRSEGIDLLYGHRCTNGRHALGRIDITSGERHQLIEREPLHVEASVKCVACGDHGFIRNGRWEAA